MLAAHRRQQRSGAISLPSEQATSRLPLLLRRLLRRFSTAPTQLMAGIRRKSVANWQTELGSQLELAVMRRRQRTVSLSSLLLKTSFDCNELKDIYRRFKDECPYGVMHEESLHRILSQMFPLGNAHHFAHYVFCCFDTARTGSVSFEQFAMSLNILLKGSYEDRLRWIFCMYDINKDGEISRRELAEVINAIFELMGNKVWPPTTADTVHECADEAFDKLDVDRDGRISWQDFYSYCCADTQVLAGMDSLRTLIT